MTKSIFATMFAEEQTFTVCDLKFTELKVLFLLLKLKNCSKEEAEEIITCMDAQLFSIILETSERVLEELSYDDKLISDNFHLLFIHALSWNNLTEEPEIIKHVYSISSTYCCEFPKYREALEQMGFIEALVRIVSREISSKTLITSTHSIYSCISAALLLLDFLPPLPRTENLLNLNLCSRGILLNGRYYDDANDHHRREISSIVLKLFPLAFQSYEIQNDFHLELLLVKTSFWADALDVLNIFLRVELIERSLGMLSSNEAYRYVIGSSLLKILVNDSVGCFKHGSLQNIFEHAIPNAISRWNEEMCCWGCCDELFTEVLGYLGIDECVMAKMFILGTRDQMITSSLHLRKYLVTSMLNFLLPEQNDRPDFDSKLQYRWYRLQVFTDTLLNIQSDRYHWKGRLVVDEEGIKNFEYLVGFVRQVVDDVLAADGYFKLFPDMQGEGGRSKIAKAENVNLGLLMTPSFSRVLGDSRSPTELKTITIVQALRLLSILNELNENWGVVFCALMPDKLIDRGHFVSKFLEKYIFTPISADATPYLPRYSYHIAAQYRFLIPLWIRLEMFKADADSRITKHDGNSKYLNITISRKNIAKLIASNLNKFLYPETFWIVNFVGEEGRGQGPTKEFFTEFSRDCQRHDLDLWLGEPINCSNGLVYAHSSCGLFPKPNEEMSQSSKDVMRSIGVIIAKSIIEKHRMNVNFSSAFYKCLRAASADTQTLTLNDMKDVMPNVYKFVSTLVDALREKWSIRADESLTEEEQKLQVSNITCDGCSFEDLCINFTIPGFPDIEMMENGSETLLTIENLEHYLELLVWKVLYKGPQESIKEVWDGFNYFLPSSCMNYFYPDEIEEVLCGVKMEQWSVEYLKTNSNLEDGLAEGMPVVQHLFEVLSTLSASEQGQFLQFVTSSPRLPIGGLCNLKPQLTIKHRGTEGNPDMYFPSSMTCTNTLFINDYSCKEILKEKLLWAIRDVVDFQFF